jgi:PhnB protein
MARLAPGPSGAGSVIFLNDDFPEFCGGESMTATALGGTPVTIHRYVPDCDAAVEQAVAAGAKVLMPPMDMLWGDRYATITDPYGHNWSPAAHQYDYTSEQIAEASHAAFAQAEQGGSNQPNG